MPKCNANYVGDVTAECSSGAWIVSGSCTTVPCAASPTIADGTAGNCLTNSPSGTTCSPTCNTGFTGTITGIQNWNALSNFIATCTQGVWNVTGVCASVAGPPCATLPTVMDGTIGNCVANAPSGTTCIPTCNVGFGGNLLVLARIKSLLTKSGHL